MNDIEQAAQRFAILDHAPIGQFVLRQDFVVLFWNRCLEAWTGIAREKIVGSCILGHFPHLGTAKYASRIAGIFAGGPPTVFSSQLHKYVIPAALPGGKQRFQYTVVTAVPAAAGEGCDAMFAIQDVTSLTEAIENHRCALQQTLSEMEERKKAQAELLTYAEELKKLNLILEERSIRDGLTGLFNHRHFYDVLHRDFLLASRGGKDIACLLLDLDYFKQVNDSYGHPCGDFVLKEVAALVRRSVRETDVVARYGGEEFAVLLPDTDLEGARVFAERVRSAVEQQLFRFETTALRVTVSIGLSTRLSHRLSHPPDLLAWADRALYRAKGDGRNRLVYAPPTEAGSSPLPPAASS
jgi:diguanylate cyclase (GGDEF)-like protein/PAS domain S-box-containing protein